MLRAKRTLVILSLALAGCRSSIAEPTATPQFVSVRMLTTTGTHILLQNLASEYTRTGVQLTLEGEALAWETLYSRLQSGEAPYALTPYLPENTTLWAAPIGQDGLAIIVHPSNTIPLLTLEDLQLLFQGRATTWADVGGSGDLPVTVVSREAGADTRLIFDQLVMGDRRTTLNARLALSDSSVLDCVATTPGAVGYVSMAALDGRVRPVPLLADGSTEPVLPTPNTVSAGLYMLTTPLLIVGLEPPQPGSIYRDWFAWMQSETGQEIVGQHYGRMAR